MNDLVKTNLNGLCEFMSGSIKTTQTMPYYSKQFKASYNIATKTYLRTLMAALLLDICIQSDITPHKDISGEALLRYALFYDLHNSTLAQFILDEHMREEMELAIVKNRLLGLSGLSQDIAKNMWLASKVNPDNPMNQLLNLADIIVDLFDALNQSADGNRFASLQLIAIFNKLIVPMRGNINELQTWFIEKFTPLIPSFNTPTEAEENDQV